MPFNWPQIVAFFLNLLTKGKEVGKKKGGTYSYRGLIATILIMLYMGQRDNTAQVAVVQKNQDTLKVEMRLHLQNYEEFKKDYSRTITQVESDLKDVDDKIDRVKDNYADQLIQLYNNRRPQRK